MGVIVKDYDWLTGRIVETGGTGTAQIMFQPTTGVIWFVDRGAIRAKLAAGGDDASVLRVYLGSIADENLIDGSDTGQFDIADNGSPWYIPDGQPLILVWTGLAAASVCTARLQIRIANRDSQRIGSMELPVEDVLGKRAGGGIRRPRHKITRAYGGW